MFQYWDIPSQNAKKLLTQKILNVNRTFDRDQSVRSLSKRPSSISLDSLLRYTSVKCTAQSASGNQHRKGVAGPVDFWMAVSTWVAFDKRPNVRFWDLVYSLYSLLNCLRLLQNARKWSNFKPSLWPNRSSYSFVTNTSASLWSSRFRIGAPIISSPRRFRFMNVFVTLTKNLYFGQKSVFSDLGWCHTGNYLYWKRSYGCELSFEIYPRS